MANGIISRPSVRFRDLEYTRLSVSANSSTSYSFPIWGAKFGIIHHPYNVTYGGICIICRAGEGASTNFYNTSSGVTITATSGSGEITFSSTKDMYIDLYDIVA